MSRFLSARFAGLAEYTPGEQPRRGQFIKLNTNESPYPPSESVLRAVNRTQVSNLNLYSDPDNRDLIPALANRYGVKSENVLVANGSDEVLNFAFMGFCDADKPVAFPALSYGFYPVYANLYRLDALAIPLQADYSIDPGMYCGIGRNIVIANPNAPTGLTISRKAIAEIARTNRDHVVLIDEAYIDFGGESSVELTKEYDNLLVCMTYSKSRCMAGARLGFAIGHKDLISDLNKLRNSTNPYNVNSLTAAAGLAALQDEPYYAECCRKIIETREWTKARLRERGFQATDSQTNFLFVETPLMKGAALYAALREKGILVRHFANPATGERLRVSIGTKEQMEQVVQAVDEILGGRI